MCIHGEECVHTWGTACAKKGGGHCVQIQGDVYARHRHGVKKSGHLGKKKKKERWVPIHLHPAYLRHKESIFEKKNSSI